MICQYCGHKLTDGKCLNPACPEGQQITPQEASVRLTWTQTRQVHRWAKNTNYTIAEMARKLDCPSIWVVWALEGR